MGYFVRNRRLAVVILLIFSVILLYAFSYHFKSAITGFFGLVGVETVPDPSIVLNLTFDDPLNPWKDYSSYNHVFQVNGDVRWLDKTYCKWNGCANFSSPEGFDYLNSSTKFTLDNGIAFNFWVYHTISPKTTSSAALGMGHIDEGTRKFSQSSLFGRRIELYAESGIVNTGTGSSNADNANVWIHYFIQYDENRVYIWRNGILLKNVSQPFGNLNYTVGELLHIGLIAPWGSTNLQGYLDEFTMWNVSDFTTDDVLTIYNEKKLGTPPDIDLYIKDIKYTLPYNFADSRNRLITGGTMNINFTIANAGIKNSGNFNYEFTLEENNICSGTINVNAGGEITINCPWTTSSGFHKGFITLDTSNQISEDVEDNNKQRVYIPFLDRPFFHFNLDEWNNDIKPFSSNPSNEVAFKSYEFNKAFSCDKFSDSYIGNSVDPFGKKARECALSCLFNDYTEPEAPSKTQCTNAKNHLFGWANRTVTSYTDVQAIHELAHVGMAYDIMFPILTEIENEVIVRGFYDICQQITNLDNTRPDLDDDSKIIGDNGKGFGSGMGSFCYSILGAYPENPTLIQQLPQQYWGKNIADEWVDREVSYLRAYKNDSWAKYQERWLYKFYSQFHLVENWIFEKKHNLIDLSQYQNAFCSMAREMLTDTLDFNYNGKDSRNDESRKLRGVQAGDSNSYEDPGSGSLVAYSIMTYYGILCDDSNTKQSILWLRDYAFSKATSTSDRGALINYPDVYLYPKLYNEINGVSKNPDSTFPKVIFDNANDILTIRTNYSYVNDIVIQIDGGEEKGGGHSQAQGYYLYALGEPFLDYEQVPFEDDTRMDVWKNGISLQNTTQTVEGTGGVFNNNCGDAGYNQYYGMSDCPTPKYPDDYPNYRHFPLQYGGDLEDYIGTKDAKFAGVYVWRPYKNADNVREYFVKFGDLLAKRTVVTNNLEGNIFHNFININDEFTETRSGTNITFQKGNKYLSIKVINTSQILTVGGGETKLQYCFAKTSCSGSNRGSGKYRRTYYHTPSSDLDMIISHHWYYEGQEQPITSIGTNDKGMKQGDNFILFDTSGDGQVSFKSKTATGWALAYNDVTKEVGAFNTTLIKLGGLTLLIANDTLSAHLSRSTQKIILTANTMQRNGYIDYPKTVRITIDAQELSNVNEFVITKNDVETINIISQTGNKVTFDITTGQNSDYYTITRKPGCILKSARWSRGRAIEGEPIDIILTGTGCVGVTVNLSYWEVDNATDIEPLNDTLKPGLLNLPENINMSSSTHTYTWTTQWMNDTDSIQPDPEYAFNATSNNTVISGQLKVVKLGYKALNISLNKGWKLVNIPVVMDNPTVDYVFREIVDKIDVIYTFDPVNRWLIYHFDKSIPSNDFNITAGRAYRIKAKENTTLVINGTISTLPRTLVVGWHLIGLKQTDEISFKDFFELYADKIEIGWELVNDTYEQISILSNDKMLPVRGYWLLINETITISG